MTDQKTERVAIYDTTLREGDQAPGVSLDLQQKVALAHQLARLGVDAIEAGFPMTSPGEMESVRAVARALTGDDPPAVAAIARPSHVEITRAHEAVKDATRPRINIFIGASPQLQQIWRTSPHEALTHAREAVEHARTLLDDVQFSLVDVGRADLDYLREFADTVAAAGATTIALADNAGRALPHEMSRMTSALSEQFAARPDLTIATHCHNDLGLAVANTLSACRAGARQAEGTINGIGVRAGVAALEEFVAILDTRRTDLGLHTRIAATELFATSGMVSKMTGYQVGPTKPIVGANAFVYESGTHQEAMQRDPEAYQTLAAESVGQITDIRRLGKHSGVAGLRDTLTAAGYQVTPRLLRAAFYRLKELGDTGPGLVDVHDLVRDCQDEPVEA